MGTLSILLFSFVRQGVGSTKECTTTIVDGWQLTVDGSPITPEALDAWSSASREVVVVWIPVVATIAII